MKTKKKDRGNGVSQVCRMCGESNPKQKPMKIVTSERREEKKKEQLPYAKMNES
jgi:ribosomal protein S26